jgi:NO-binding membrane sensor protein with MHYT domain
MVALAWVVLGLLAAHDATHLLDDGLDTPLGLLAAVAIPQWLFLGVAMGVVLRGEESQARLAALLIGISVAIGFAAIHLLPVSPAAYWDLDPSGISWCLAWAPAVAALALVVSVSRSAAGASRGTPPSPRARRASGSRRP